MKETELFGNILEENETIEKVLKPNKLKYFCSTFLGAISAYLLILILGLIIVLVPNEDGTKMSPIFALIPVGIFVLCFLVTIIFSVLSYKEIYYAYTNKRVIIRSGAFGVDFKSLDLSIIGAVDVYVSPLDHFLRKGTGTIYFGSIASPMQQGARASAYRFAHVDMAYESYKEIKSFIDEHKEAKQK